MEKPQGRSFPSLRWIYLDYCLLLVFNIENANYVTTHRLHNEWYCRYIAPGSEAAQNYQNNQKKKDLEREMRTSANQTHEELDPESYRVISAVMLSILKKKQKA